MNKLMRCFISTKFKNASYSTHRYNGDMIRYHSLLAGYFCSCTKMIYIIGYSKFEAGSDCLKFKIW